jgi:cellulose synthase/poly-beta-1,6-N-acetylglucosamine synthase-like glycosyltransferase
VAGAAGELFSVRTELWQPLPEHVILDDFVISARINLQGYRIAYAPDAWASELPSASLVEEKKRKIRISAGAFQTMCMLKPLFNIFRHPILFFQFFSHRFLRWTLVPLSLPLLFLSNLVLVWEGTLIFYHILFISQIVFYFLALAGYYFGRKDGCPAYLKIFYYIFFMNYSVYLGFFRFLRGGQMAVWEKAARKVEVSSGI